MADRVLTALSTATDSIVAAVTATRSACPVVLIDGRSGAGKTSLSRALVSRWPLSGGVQLIALDTLYPGWDGLAAGVAAAHDQILTPHARGAVGTWRAWDWDASRFADASTVDPALPLIVEGSGILTRSTATLGDIRVWLESPETSRRARALNRDGDLYRPHWSRWALQEQRHLIEDDPVSCATHVFRVP
jgi:hypothetical protein